MKAVKKNIICTVVLSSLLLAFTISAAAECVRLSSDLIGDSCDPENWCWFFWGQTEYYYHETFDCDGDGLPDEETINTEQGDCCAV